MPDVNVADEQQVFASAKIASQSHNHIAGPSAVIYDIQPIIYLYTNYIILSDDIVQMKVPSLKFAHKHIISFFFFKLQFPKTVGHCSF